MLFIPYAAHRPTSYGPELEMRFKTMGLALDFLPENKKALPLVKRADAFYIGGGNTFRLLFKLQKYDLIPRLRDKIFGGTPFLGSSAGAITASPTIQTTNTIATLWPTDLKALNLVPFYINPHYTPTDPKKHTTGETREERFEEFLEENNKIILALGEGNFLRVKKGKVILGGTDPAYIFKRGKSPLLCNPKTDLTAPLTK